MNVTFRSRNMLHQNYLFLYFLLHDVKSLIIINIYYRLIQLIYILIWQKFKFKLRESITNKIVIIN